MAYWITFILVSNNEPVAINLDRVASITPTANGVVIDGVEVRAEFQELMLSLKALAWQ